MSHTEDAGDFEAPRHNSLELQWLELIIEVYQSEDRRVSLIPGDQLKVFFAWIALEAFVLVPVRLIDYDRQLLFFIGGGVMKFARQGSIKIVNGKPLFDWDKECSL